MSNPIKIDLVAPPFGGHLYPALQLGRGLHERGGYTIRVLSTRSAKAAVQTSGLSFVEILSGRDQQVLEIANTPYRVGSNPLRLWKQVRSNLALMSEFKQQVHTEWQQARPDLVLVDFVVPVAGLAASELGIPWWTGMPTPCALETATGTPAYLGGWQPVEGWYGRCRDWLGRRAVHTFKQTTHRLFAQPLRELGIDSLYRPDGLEVIYSPTRILGYGLEEFEFPRDWPSHFTFIGPLPLPPPFPVESELMPNFDGDRKRVLVSLGTHLDWAKRDALELIRQVSQLLPEIEFHFSHGSKHEAFVVRENNLHRFSFIPYSDLLTKYSAVIHHGGTGILYACLNTGLPALVGPLDYDQFDHAARLIHHRLAKRLARQPWQVACDLQKLLTDSEIAANVSKFHEVCQSARPIEVAHELIQNEFFDKRNFC